MAAAAAAVFAFVLAVSLAGAGVVSAQTNHVVSGGPDFNVTAWLLGRSFTVGDKIRFEESMVELRGAEELASCDVNNPIKMYTEAESHVALEEEGVRFFASSNPDTCRKGLKLPVPVNRHDPYDKPDEHEHDPDLPEPPFEPEPEHEHEHEHDPDVPEPPFEPEPYKPDVPYPPSPSAATRLNAICCFFSAAAAAVLSIYHVRSI